MHSTLLCLLILSTSDLIFAGDDEAQLQFEIVKPSTSSSEATGSVVRRVRDAASATVRCANVMPGSNRLRRGIDVTKLDLMSLSSISGDDGFRKPIVDYTCSEGKTINVRIPGGDLRTYDLPDEIWDVAALPGGFLSEHVEIFKSSHQVKKSMSVTAGVDVLGGMFSASASYKKMSSSLNNQSRYLETVQSVVSASRVDLAPFWGLTLSRYAKTFVDRRLPATFDANPTRYAQFISHFGTHYFAHGKFGGVIKLLLETESSYFYGKTESQVKAQAGGMFKNILKAKGGYTGATTTIDEEFRLKTTKTIRYHGGDTNLLDAEGLRRWQPTVAENPWLFGGQLKPLSDLFEEIGENKKKAMERAIQVHLDKARLDAAKRLVYAKMAAMQGNGGAVATLKKYLADCEALSRLSSPQHDKVDTLCDEIERELVVPDWFRNDVKICYRWSPGGDAGQCGGGGVGRLLCASVDEFTQYYLDDTDNRGHGCRMSWGIQAKPTAPAWFKDSFKICYRWYPTGAADQCGGGAARNLCANVGNYTAYYLDDTDNRRGGCMMSWKLVVGSSAPLWAKNLDLCFQWYWYKYPVRVRRFLKGIAISRFVAAVVSGVPQCGGNLDADLNRNVCARTNTWTQYYRDSTNDWSGGCRMRWGIVSK